MSPSKRSVMVCAEPFAVAVSTSVTSVIFDASIPKMRIEFAAIWDARPTSLTAAHAQASCSLTFAPCMKKTFAFSARAANGGATAANAKSVAAMWR